MLPGEAVVSVYARRRDYHKVLRSRLQKLQERIAQAIGPFGHRVFTDSAPVLEAELAAREFHPTLKRLISVNTFGTPSTWRIDTDRGEVERGRAALVPHGVRRGRERCARLRGDGAGGGARRRGWPARGRHR